MEKVWKKALGVIGKKESKTDDSNLISEKDLKGLQQKLIQKEIGDDYIYDLMIWRGKFSPKKADDFLAFLEKIRTKIIEDTPDVFYFDVDTSQSTQKKERSGEQILQDWINQEPELKTKEEINIEIEKAKQIKIRNEGILNWLVDVEKDFTKQKKPSSKVAKQVVIHLVSNPEEQSLLDGSR